MTGTFRPKNSPGVCTQAIAERLHAMSTLKSRCKIYDYALISVRPYATGAANIGGINVICLFQRAGIQVNKYKCGKLSTKTEFFPGESILRFIHQS